MAAAKRLPVYHHSADYIFRSFGIIGLILSQFEKKKKFSVAGASEHGQCFIITLLHMNRLNKTESADLRFFDVFLLPEDLLSELFFISTAAGFVPCGGR